MNRTLTNLLAVFLALSATFACYGQQFPSRPLRIIVPNTAGSPPDVVARIVSPQLSAYLGQPIVIEVKPGAATIIGHEYVAKQVPADGYTIAIVSTSGLALLPVTVKDLRFDALTDLPPFVTLVESRYAFITSSTLQWKTFTELISFAKSNPGKLFYGASAPSVRLPVEVIVQELNLAVTHVPYTSGGGPYFQALAAGDVHMGFVAESVATNLGDKVRVLAVTGQGKSKLFTGAPTFRELGFPQIRGFSFSLNAPAGTPPANLDKLYTAASQALQQSDVKSQLSKLQYDIIDAPRSLAVKDFQEQAKLFASIAKKAGIKPE